MATKNYKKLIKWSLYIVFSLILFLFQIAPTKLAILSDVQFLIPFVVCIACFESLVPSSVFAVILGLAWDYSVQRQFGYNAIILLVICTTASLLTTYFVKPIMPSVIACIFAAAVVYALLDFFFFFVLKGYEGIFKIFTSQYLPMCLATLVFGIIIYVIFKCIYKIKPNRAKFDS